MKNKILAEIEKRIIMKEEIIRYHEKETDSVSSVPTMEGCLARLNELLVLKKIISNIK